MMLSLASVLVTALVISSTAAQTQNDRLGRKLYDPGKRSTPVSTDLNVIPAGASPSVTPKTSLIKAVATVTPTSTDILASNTSIPLVTTMSTTLVVASPNTTPMSNGSASASLPQTAPGSVSTCGQKGTHALVNCLFGSSTLTCTATGGGCGVLARYLPISPDDETACYPDVQVAAEVCAQCSATKDGYDLYNSYLDTCFTLYPAKKVEATGGVSVPGGSESTPRVTPSATASTGGVLTGSSETGGVLTGAASGSGTVTPTVQIPSGSPVAGTITPAGGAGTLSAATPIVISSTTTRSLFNSTLPPARTSSVDIREGSTPDGVIANESGLLTTVPTLTTPIASPSSIVAVEQSVPSAVTTVGADGAPITYFVTPSAVPSASIPVPTSSNATQPLATGKPELASALLASQLFFAQIIDPGCQQEEDGCPVWQAAASVAVDASVCAAAKLKGAADCSACVGAAGMSDQAVYKAQMEAYGWYSKNCTLAAAGSNAGTGAAGTGLNAVEQVDPAKPVIPGAAISTGVPSASGVALAANADATGVGKTPKVQYVDEQSLAPVVAVQGGGRRSKEVDLGGVLVVCALAMMPLLL